MAMTKCRECGASVSTEADDCPQCGCENPAKSTHWGKIIGRVVLVLGVLVILGGLLNRAGLSEPPLSVVTRDSLVGEGKVFIITNTSNEPLHECRLSLEAPGGESYGPVVFSTTLAPHKSVEVGWLELNDWKPSPGQTVDMSCKDFGNLKRRL